MKAIFLSLVLVNLAYLGWQAWIVPEKAPLALNETDGVARLVLIGEDPDDPGLGTPYKVPTRASEIKRKMTPRRSPVSESAAEQSTTQVQPPAADDTAEKEIMATVGTPSPAVQAAVNEALREPVVTATDEVSFEPVEVAVDEALRKPFEMPTDELAGEPVEVAAVQRGLTCVSLGPFLNLREATEASAMLIEAGLQTSQRLSESQVWFGHWVHLPALATRDAAVAVVEDLKKNGVTDIYIEPSGPMKNSISLGVFSDREHAETRAGRIRRFGISPQIRDRYRDSSVYWVDFAIPEDQAIDPNAYQASPNRVLRIEPRTCPEDA